jgi:hypothetical protein
MRELLDIFAESVIAVSIVTAIVAVLHGLYYIGEYIVETAYEKYYGAQDWEAKWKWRKRDIKDLLKIAAYMALFGAGMLFAGYASDWFVASVYRLLADMNGRIV